MKIKATYKQHKNFIEVTFQYNEKTHSFKYKCEQVYKNDIDFIKYMVRNKICEFITVEVKKEKRL